MYIGANPTQGCSVVQLNALSVSICHALHYMYMYTCTCTCTPVFLLMVACK